MRCHGYPGVKPLAWVVAIVMLVVAGGAGASQAAFRERAASKMVTPASASADVRAEILFGRQVAARILSRYTPDNNAKLERYVNLVGDGLAAFSSRPELHFHFAIIDTDDVNAYSAPGGYVFVTRGALKLMRDESELAGVLAHEIAHVTLKQIVRELNIHGTTQSPEAGFAHFFGGAGDPARIAFSQAVDKAMNILFREGLSKQDEFDADRVGTQLLAEAGYDPTALERYLARVKQAKGESTQIINHTHPPFDQRIARLKQFIVQQGMAGVTHPRLAARFESYVNGKK